MSSGSRSTEREIWGEEKKEEKKKKGAFWIPNSRKAREFHSEKLKIFYMFV